MLQLQTSQEAKNDPELLVRSQAVIVLGQHVASDFNSNREDLHVINLEESPTPSILI